MARSQFMKKVTKVAKNNPEQRVSIVVKLNKGLSEVASELESAGIKTRHEYKLMEAFSAEVSVDQAVWLERKSWVTKIEEDKEVRASKE